MRGKTVAVLLAASLFACQRDAAPVDPARLEVAVVSGKPLTRSDVDRASRDSASPVSPAVVLERAIATRLAADEARRRGLDAPPRDRSQGADEALQQALYDSISAAVELPEEDLRAEYQRTAAQLVARQIVLRRREFASEAEARAAGPLAASGAEQLGPLPVESLPVSVLPEALTLSAPGQRAVVARDGRFAVVELVEIRAAEPLSYELARARLERSLRLRRAQAAYQAELERLRREADVEIDANALAEGE
jgi:hypothetical protein